MFEVIWHKTQQQQEQKTETENKPSMDSGFEDRQNLTNVYMVFVCVAGCLVRERGSCGIPHFVFLCLFCYVVHRLLQDCEKFVSMCRQFGPREKNKLLNK